MEYCSRKSTKKTKSTLTTLLFPSSPLALLPFSRPPFSPPPQLDVKERAVLLDNE
jgi:hypothetical protein